MICRSAVTEESTPTDKAQITFSFLTSSFIFFKEFFIKFDIFHHRIFVFSPKGDVFELPEGANAIDFAYLVHTDIGNKATGVKTNDQLSTLEKALKDGDVVEVFVDKNRKGPNYSWINSVKTKRAKEKIKQ